MMPERRISVAPMMDYTDRHERYFLRLFSSNMWLYTEMVTCQALLHGDVKHHLQFNSDEHPIALQLGGSDKEQLSQCAVMAEDFGYDEVNLNVGCPSDRVKSGKFGACLMSDPNLVAECIASMQQKVSIPITVKCRIGIDDQDEYKILPEFIETVSKSDCDIFVIHARKAWLKGLSPKENRDVPPLKYQLVYDIKQAFPALTISVNGGIQNLQEAKHHLNHVDGVMIGRAAYHNPYILAHVDHEIYGTSTIIHSRKQILESYLPYIEKQLHTGTKLSNISRHILGLFQGLKGARQWRRFISENAIKPGAGIDVILKAASFVEE